MGATCSTGGGTAHPAGSSQIHAEIQKEVAEFAPQMLQYLTSGLKSDYEHEVRPHCCDQNVTVVFRDGSVTRMSDITNIMKSEYYHWSNATATNPTNVRAFAGELAAVCTVNVLCGYDHTPGTYEILRDTYMMKGASMDSGEAGDLNQGEKVKIDKVVAVKERLRGRVGKNGFWITLAKKGDRMQFAKCLSSITGQKDKFTYTLVLEKVEDNENVYRWKLRHLTINGEVA